MSAMVKKVCEPLSRYLTETLQIRYLPGDMTFSDRLYEAGVTATRFAALTGFRKRTVFQWCNSDVPAKLNEIVYHVLLAIEETGTTPPVAGRLRTAKNDNVLGVYDYSRQRY